MSKLLLVDDENKFRISLAKRLELRGYKTVALDNGIEAVKVVRNDPEIDVVILDRKMPGISGEQVLKEISEVAPKEAILASGSSKLLISEIQRAVKNPGRCIGAHGFNPPHLIPLVEIIPGEMTSDQTVDRTRSLMKSLGKVPIVVKKEVSAYLGNRMQYSVNQAARDIVESGVASVEEVDLAMSTGLGLRWALYGPFMVSYFNTPSHLIRRYDHSGLVAEGLEDHSMLKGKTFDDLVRWRNSKLIDILRVVDRPLSIDSKIG